MRKLALALAGLLAFAANAASAQTLTRGQEGRVAIALCYSACMASGERLALAGLAKVERLTDLLLSPQFQALTQAGQAAVLEVEQEGACLLAQEGVRNADTCQVACVDLEQAYDVQTSHARNRFREAFQDDMTSLRNAGLWTNYRTSPEPGTAAFSRACNTWLSSDGASASAVLSKRIRAAAVAAPERPKPNND